MKFQVTYTENGLLKNIIIEAPNFKMAGKEFHSNFPSIKSGDILGIYNISKRGTVQLYRSIYAVVFIILGISVYNFAKSHEPGSLNQLIGNEPMLSDNGYNTALCVSGFFFLASTFFIVQFFREPKNLSK